MSQALRGHRGLRHRQQQAARLLPGFDWAAVPYTSIFRSFVPFFSCAGHIPAIGLERPRAHLFSVERHMRIVMHIGDLQIHMLALGLGRRGELHAIGRRPGKRR